MSLAQSFSALLGLLSFAQSANFRLSAHLLFARPSRDLSIFVADAPRAEVAIVPAFEFAEPYGIFIAWPDFPQLEDYKAVRIESPSHITRAQATTVLWAAHRDTSTLKPLLPHEVDNPSVLTLADAAMLALVLGEEVAVFSVRLAPFVVIDVNIGG